MTEFDLVFSSKDNEDFSIFTNINLQDLVDPIDIARQEKLKEEDIVYDKKKSELVDYEKEEYIKLKLKEQDPYIISDSEAKTFSGKFQDNSDTSSMYFAMINTGKYLKMVPVSKWYGFVQINQFPESAANNTEKLEKKLVLTEEDESYDTESDHEIDYENEFDDDDGEVYYRVEKEKKLSSSGKKIQGLMENYNEEAVNKKEESEEAEENNKKIKIEKKLGKEDIRKIFGNVKISVKDLLIKLKSEFSLGEEEKKTIKEFLHENCSFETDQKSGEKMFKLKK